MATERIEHLISKEALSQFDELNAKLALSIVGFEKLVAKGVEINKALGSSKGFKEINKGAQELTANERALTDQVKQLESAQAKLNIANSKQAKELAGLKVQQQQRNKELRDEAILSNQATGAFQKLAITLEKLKTEYKNLVTLEKENTAEGKKLKAEIDSLQVVFEKANTSVKDFRFNVGNYPGAAKTIVDALERARAKTEQLTKTMGDTHPATQAARRELDGLTRITENPGFLNLAGKGGDATRELKQLTKSLIELERGGLGSSQVAIDLRGQLASLQDQVSDTRAEIKALASDTRTFDLFAGAVNIVADSFQAAAGTIGLFTDSEEEVQQVTKNLIAIQAISNGIKGIANELTTRGTAANKIYSFYQNQVAIATNSSATATARLGAGFKLLASGLIIGAIIAIVTNFTKLKNLLSGLTKEQALNNDINKKAVEGYVKEKVQVESLAREAKNENTTKQRKKEIIVQLNQISPTYFGNIKTEQDLHEKLTDSVSKYIKAIELKARAEVAYQKLVEAEAPIIERRIKLEQDLERARNARFDTEERRQKQIAGLEKTIATGSDKILQTLQKQVAPVRKVVDDINKELDALGGDPDGSGVKVLENENKNLLELQKIKLGIVIDTNQRISANEEKTQDERLKSIMKTEQAQLRIIELNKKQALQNAQLTASDIQVIEANAYAERIKTQREFLQQRVNLTKQFAEREFAAQFAITKSSIEIGSEKSLRIADDEKKSLTARLSANKVYFDNQKALIVAQRDFELRSKTLTETERLAIQKKADNELLLLQLDFIKKSNDITTQGLEQSLQRSVNINNKRRDLLLENLAAERQSGLIGEEDYQKKRTDIEFKYAQSDLQILMNGLRNQIDERRKNGEDITELEAQLAAYQRQLREDDLEHTKLTEEQKFQIRVEKLQKLGAISNNIFSAIGELQQIQFDTEKARIEEAIAEIEKKRDAELAAINASALSEQEKADKIQILEAKTQAQKEQQERRLRQLESDRARFERAITVQRIIADTAAAIVAALGAKPYSPLNIALAATVGALGAAQLARVIATPLPRFAHGTEDAPGGLSVLGDAGRSELVKEPGGKMWVTPKVPTVMNVPKHSIVYPDARLMLESGLVVNRDGRLVERGNDTGKIEEKLDKLTSVIRNKPVLNMKADQGGLTAMWQYGANWITYVEDNVRF